jgi:hypothetical protein
MNIVEACQYGTQSCINFKKINDLVIKMVNNHYFDLQMYANYVFDIDNEKENLSKKNNFHSRIIDVQKKFETEYSSMPLFTKQHMIDLEDIVSKILNILKDNRISASQYLSNIVDMQFFGSGAASSTILLKVLKHLSNNNYMPLVIKLIPFQLPHHYQYLSINDNQKKEFIWAYIESPSYALFIKEAWMYCFSKNELLKYTPTFTCVSNCYIIEGLPIKGIDEILNIYKPYAQKRISAGKNLPYKKWFNILIDPNEDMSVKKEIITANYGCFEMRQIDGTLDDILTIPGSFNLSIVFEFLYTKIIAAFIGKIIFTDDHFGNVAFINVDYTRAYKIKCNGCNYFFYMPPGKMVQFIDLERYVFNYTRYDIYTNTALKSIPDSDFINTDRHLNEIKNSYLKNNFIFDKSLSTLLNNSFGETNFSDKTEYQIMLQILTSPFVHDIKTFCQIMEENLPQKYLIAPDSGQIEKYYLDLDDDSLRIINYDKVRDQIR